MGLCDWIAPGYKPSATPKDAAEQFAQALFGNPSYQIVRRLANHTKHQGRNLLEAQTAEFVERIDDLDTPIDSWINFDRGPASSYKYGEHDLLQVFESVARFYDEHWFNLPIEEQLRQ